MTRALARTSDLTRLEPIARIGCYAWIIGFGVWVWWNSPGSDAHAYWAADYADPYRFGLARTDDAYLYSPAFLHALFPLKLLPWEAFWFAWVAVMVGGIVWLTRPYVASLVLIPVEQNPVFTEVWYGNIAVLLAVMVALGVRYAPVWSFGLLTKVTPGVGALWFVGRRDWRGLWMALGLTGAIVAVSFLLSPQAWFDWADMLRVNATNPPVDGDVRLPPLTIRGPIAAALVLFAGWRNWPLLLPPAIILALPVFWFASLTILLASFRLAPSQVLKRRDAAPGAGAVVRHRHAEVGRGHGERL